MATKVIMPQLGESVVDGTVGEWLKQVGDPVEEYEPIVRVSTDKVDTEIPAPVDGVLLAIYVEEGETVDAGVLLGVVGEEGENPEDASGGEGHSNNGSHPQEEPQPEPAASTTSRSSASTGRYTGHVTPVVMRMAQEHNLDLSQIEGTGRNGRIRKKDVLAYLEQREEAAPQQESEPAPWEIPADGDLFKPTVDYSADEDDEPTPQPARQQAPKPAAPPRPAPVPTDLPGELVKHNTMRRSIAKHMVESKLQTAPHVTTVMEADLTNVVAHRAAHKDELAKRGVKLTFTPYFVAAIAVALQEHPVLNARWTDEGLFYPNTVNIGMATALDDGLIVPVIHNAQDYNLAGLARQVNDLAERARNRQLQPDEVRNGTFSITNHGVTGSLLATPIINQPQSAILGVGKIEKRVKVVDDMIAVRPCSYLSLTFDHRVADGATADTFLARIVEVLENWS
jgi:2-oxoglutarate dehydrogenase E2 component (dihydrolipoamide succinyltransferase)